MMPPSKFWEIWDKTPFGAVAWTHRPLGTMVLSLGYRTGVPWNDCHYANPEFDKTLDEAESTLDVEARRTIMAKLEKMLQDDAVMVMPIWRPIFSIASQFPQGLPPASDQLPPVPESLAGRIAYPPVTRDFGPG